MDPDEALRQIRHASVDLDMAQRRGDSNGILNAQETITECAIALDGWISGGGYLPREWQS